MSTITSFSVMSPEHGAGNAGQTQRDRRAPHDHAGMLMFDDGKERRKDDDEHIGADDQLKDHRLINPLRCKNN